MHVTEMSACETHECLTIRHNSCIADACILLGLCRARVSTEVAPCT